MRANLPLLSDQGPDYTNLYGYLNPPLGLDVQGKSTGVCIDEYGVARKTRRHWGEMRPGSA